jgi:hypothetical protein
LCVGKTNIFNPLASDADNDSLIFSLETPYSPYTGNCFGSGTPDPYPKGHSSFSTVIYRSGYSLSNPFGGTSTVSINSRTGEITAKPSSTGYYVIAVQVKEYRVDPVTKKVKYLGEIRRDLQFLVGNCTSAGKAPDFVTDTIGYTKYIIPGEKLCFDVSITDTLNTDTLTIYATGGVFKGSATIDTPYATFTGDTAVLKATGTFCWKPSCAQVTYTSPYVVTFLGYDQNCNQVSKTYSIYVKPRVLIKPPIISCIDALNDSTLKLTIKDTSKSKSSDFLQYKIYRRKGTGSFTLLSKQTSYPLKTYTDATAKGADTTIYSYYIAIENSCNTEGLHSDTISNIVVTKTKVSDKKVVFSWNAMGSKSKWYRIYTDEGSGYVLRDSNKTRTYAVSSCNKTLTANVQVADTSGCFSNSRPTKSVTVKDITPPYIANNIAAASVINYSKIRVTIRKSDSLDVKKYYVYRAVNGGSYSLLDSFNHVSGTTFYKYSDTKSIDASKNAYSYKIKAADSCGNTSGFSTAHTTILLTVKKSFLKATLTWTKYAGFTWDTVEVQKIGATGKWIKLAKVANTDTTYADTPLSCKSSYYYRVVYRNAADTFYAISDTVYVPTTDTTAPAQVNIKSVSVSSGTSITITFDKVADVDVKRYEVYYKTQGGSYSLAAKIQRTSANTYTYKHTGIDPLTKIYYYQVKAVDSCDENKSPTTETHSEVQLTGSGKNLSNQLYWTKYIGYNVKNYKVYRWNNGWSTVLATLTNTDTSYLDTGLSCNVTKYYKIEAIENGGDNATSFSDSIALAPYDTIKPKKPEITYGTVVNGTTIDLFWKKSLSSDVKKYEVSIKSSGTNWKVKDTVQALTYRFTGLKTQDSTYSFRIRALDSCANNASVYSDIHSTIQLGGQGKNLSTQLTWTAYQGFTTDKYLIYKWKSGAWQLLDSVNGSTTSYLHKPLGCNVSEIYKVVARDISGLYKSHSDSIKLTPYDTIKPAKPVFDYGTVVNGTTIKVFWEKSDSDVKKYEVSYKTSKGVWKIKDTVATLTYLFTGLNTIDSTYSFRVRAIDSCANNTSAYSDIHTMIQLTGSGKNLGNLLTWSAYQGFSVYRYYILQWTGSTWTTIDSTDQSTLQYLHKPLSCNVARIYKIQALDVGKQWKTLSDSIKLTPFDTIKPTKPAIYYTTVLSNNSIYLTWSKTPDADVRNYIIWRKKGTGSYVAIDTVVTDTEFVDNAVNTRSNYYTYQVQSYDTCANNLSPKSDPHNSILLLTHKSSCVQQIVLNWNSYINWPGGVDSYVIYRTDNDGPEAVLMTVSGTTTSYSDTVQYGDYHKYRIEAIQNGGGSFVSSSDVDSNMTFIPGTPVLLYASKLTTSTTNGKLQIKWVSQKGKQYLSYHRIYYRVAGSGNAFSLLATNIPVSQDSFIHTGINTKTTDYEYYIETVDSCGSVTAPSEVHKSMDLTMTVGQLIHQLDWTPYTGFTVDHYDIEQLRGGNWTKVDEVSGDTTLTRFPAPCNSDVFYRIKAVSDEGVTAYSDTAGGQALDTIPANAPVFENASVFSNGQIEVDFMGADSADIFGYAVLRSDNGGSYQTIGFVNFTVPEDSYIGLDATNTQTDLHCYTIATLDSCLNATFSDTFCVVQLKGQAMNQSAKLRWHPFVGYKLKQYELQELKGNVWQTIRTLTPADTSIFLDSLPCYKEKIYRIKGSEKGGTRITFSDTLHVTPFDTISPKAPMLHYVTAVPGQGMKLSWSWDKKSDVKYFDILRIDPGGSSANYIATVTRDSTYLDNSVIDLNKVYKYYVTATDSCNTNHISAPSDTDQTMTLGATTLACVPLARLQWTPYAELEKKVDAYAIFRTQGSGSPVLVKALKRNVTSYVDSTVQKDVGYCYYIAAIDSATGYYSLSAPFCITPKVYPDPERIELLYTTVTKTGSTNGEIEIAWLPVKSTDIYASGYHLYMATSPAGPYTLLHSEPNLSVTNFTYKNIDTRKTNYYFYVTPYNICAKEGPVSGIHHAINLEIANNSLNPILYWNKYQGFPVDHYEIEKSTDGSPLLPAYKATSLDSIYSDTNVLCGHVYSYRIHAINKDGLTSYSDSVRITAYDNVPPRRSDILASSVFSTSSTTGQITMDFIGAGDKNRRGYIIYRSVNGGLFAVLDTFKYTALGKIQYVDNKLDTRAKNYAYYIRSMDSCGNIALSSDTHQVVLLHVSAQNAYNHLTWSHYKGFASWRYIIERRSSGMPWKQIGVTANPIYDDYGVKCDTLYEYRIYTIELTTAYVSYSNTDTATAYEINVPDVPDIIRGTVTNTSTTGGSINVTWQPSTSQDLKRYLIYRKSDTNPWVLVASPAVGTTSYTDAGLNTYRKTYLYKILTEDSCGNVSQDNSEIHRPVNLAATAGNEFIKLDWTEYLGFTVLRYELYRDNKLIATLDPMTLTYTDTNLFCTTSYLYQVKVISSDTTISYSNTDLQKPFDSKPPKAVYVITASVSNPNDAVTIQWTKSQSYDVQGYTVYRQNASTGKMEKVYETNDKNDTTFTDSYQLNGDATCYFVAAKDACQNVSPMSNNGCVILLSGKAQSLINTIDWTPYITWSKNVKSYNVYRFDNGGWRLLQTVNGSTRTYVDQDLSDKEEKFCYQVEAIENPGEFGAKSMSTVICLTQPPITWIPNVFTPGYSIGLNDQFAPKGNYIQKYEMQIYNRWGERVYSTFESKPWDGMVKGTLAPEGVYVYKIMVYGFDGKPQYFDGTVTIMW